MSLGPRGTPAVPARIALLPLLPLPPLADPGPAPHEYRTDRHGHPLPPGAVARLGVPPALSGFPGPLGWGAAGRRCVPVDCAGSTLLAAPPGGRIEPEAVGTEGPSLYT